MRLENRVALVTGAGRGIGAATASRLASEGAAVTVADIDAEVADQVAEGIRSQGGRALGVACDVSQSAAVSAMVERTVGEFGKLDILVTCAGLIRDNLVHKMTEEDWDLVIDTHLKGSFLCAQAAQAVMVKQRFGRIVLISSTSALGNRGQANYSAAKMGIQGLARTLALELGRYEITVNVVAPGFIETRMTEATAARMGVSFEQLAQGFAATNPIARTGKPEDVAGVISFFASDDASYVTGQTLYVRGAP
ncbi:MAG: SDR family NAD(P)-dependent oxidoreductase [Candidatus Dormibacteraeota bacterium]|nr:SDR family NAD(P)-dependent oxidoreductase [Candidatus Dormibacteraeota bacterium]